MDPQMRNAAMDKGAPGQPHGTISFSAVEKLINDKIGEHTKTLTAEIQTLKTERDNKVKEMEVERRNLVVEQASREGKVIPLTADEINSIPITTLESMVAKLKPEVHMEKTPLKAMSADGKKPELIGALERASRTASDFFARAGVTWEGPAEFAPRQARNLNPKNPVDTAKSN